MEGEISSILTYIRIDYIINNYMCDNYLLCFLGLRTCTKKQSDELLLPWTHTRKYFNRSIYSNQQNYIDKNDILRCIDSHKNKYSVQNTIPQYSSYNNISFQLNLHTPSHLSNSPNTSHLSNSPTISHLSNSPTTSNRSNSPTTSNRSNSPTISHLSNSPTTSHLSNSPTISHLSNSPTISHLSNSPTISHLSNSHNINIVNQINRNYTNCPNNKQKPNNMTSIISWIYSILICGILSLPSIWYIFKYINKSSYYLPYILFYGIYPVQYMLSILYYSNDHYDRLLHLWDNTFYKNNYISITKKDFSICCILLFVIIISSINLVYLISGEYTSEYSNYINNDILYFIIFFEWMYGRTLILFNLFVFFFTFHTHIHDMKKNVDFLEKSNWIFYKDTKRISDICTEIIMKKYELEDSIQHLQNIFSSSTILGTIGFVITIINYKEFGCDLYLLILCLIYIFIQVYFFAIIITISNQQSSLKQSIRHPIFASHWLQRIKFDNKKNLNSDDLQSISIEENGTSIDWIILNTILQDKWVQFEFFGIPLNDAELIKRCGGFAGLILGINKISMDYFIKM